MNLQSILDNVMRRYPHSFENSIIIGMINDIQERLFRTIYKPETAITYDLLADNPFYPILYSPENIIDVVVNGKEYPFKNIASSSQGNFYYITEDNSIGIYPTPTEDATNGLTVFRYTEPKVLTVNDLAIEPDFDKAWHMLIVYAVCQELAQLALDSNMVNVFTMQYSGVESEYNGSKKLQSYLIQEEYGGYRW